MYIELYGLVKHPNPRTTLWVICAHLLNSIQRFMTLITFGRPVSVTRHGTDEEVSHSICMREALMPSHMDCPASAVDFCITAVRKLPDNAHRDGVTTTARPWRTRRKQRTPREIVTDREQGQPGLIVPVLQSDPVGMPVLLCLTCSNKVENSRIMAENTLPELGCIARFITRL
ncbi:hypothetical protein PYCCODRAFT_708806 [Trametes coccinea BRFM310]|uniref:Uncharacterized protein n=1 Tax=Trametes coccinea (strain BRFM310) TaxID=1353009 RepID=A0A1Y2IHX1_TRAC3|nr:hypothetical protein PYCCODRAFT_708806 [Trametes coccinea BRFM310]